MCECNLCQRLQLIDSKITELLPEQQEFFRGMVEGMLDVEFDNDYYKAIFSGEWPRGKDALLRALKKYEDK